MQSVCVTRPVACPAAEQVLLRAIIHTLSHDEFDDIRILQFASPVRNTATVLTGYLFTYYNSKVGKEREAQIDRVNEQVKDLYGPLLSCVTASKSAFDSMIQQHSPDGTREAFVSAIRENPDSREAQIYRWYTYNLI